jgi:hypothetical protein
MADIFTSPSPDSPAVPVAPAPVDPNDIARVARDKRNRRIDESDLIIDPAVHTPQTPSGVMIVPPNQ